MSLIKKALVFALVLVLSTSLLSAVVMADDTTTLAPARYGIDNLNNDPGNLYVAYLGGSITKGKAGGGISHIIEYKDNAGTGPARWTSQLTKRYFQKKYPNKNVIEVNAGLDGTPSPLGLFRLQKDIVEPCGGEGPDVVFVEFAVNDTARDVTQTSQAVEGIIRQLAHLPKQPVVIFVLSAAWKEIYGGFDKYLETAALHKQIADYYGIGSINLCEYVKGGVDIEGNEIIWDKTKKDHANAWTWDNEHPCPKGYTGYTDYIMKCFNDAPEKYLKKLNWKEAPMSGYEFHKPVAVPCDKAGATFKGNWEKRTDILPDMFGNTYATSDDGATVTLKFTGRSFGLFVARGGEGAVASCVIDGEQPKRINNYYSGEWMATGEFIITDLAPGEHTLTITTKHEEGKGKTFAFGYFLLDEETPDPILTDIAVKSGDKEISQTKAGNALSADYTFVNGNKEEKGTAFQWLKSDTKDGSYTEISGATGKTYTPDANMSDKYIKVRIAAKNVLDAEKAYESKAVKILRPSANVSFPSTKHEYTAGNKTLVNLETGDITTKASVTNTLLKSYSVSMVTAEYEILENGTKKLVNVSRDTKMIESGKTADFENTITVSDINHVLKTVILCNDSLEPIGDMTELTKNRFVFIETTRDTNDVAVSVYEIIK